MFGTTDAFGTVDPAGSYDNPGWEILYNTAQTLLSIPPGGTDPEPDAAEKCEFSDPKTYTCTLKKGLTFSDGSPLTRGREVHVRPDAQDRRSQRAVEHLRRPARVDRGADPQTVTFHLKIPDATWPFRLTTGAASIVPDESTPPTSSRR